MKKTIYVDMDNVLVDFPSGINRLDAETRSEFKDDLDEVPGIFSLMDPMPGAIESYIALSNVYELLVLSTAPWKNPSAWSDKLLWIQRYLGEHAHKRLILSHNKHLNRGDFLIDDRTANGAGIFQGELILFGSDEFPDWKSVTTYLLD